MPPKVALIANCLLAIWLEYIPNFAFGSVFEFVILDERSGQATLKISGQKCKEIFRGEPGGHRFQRVSPTEKRGRVHTSTITVAVLEPISIGEIDINPKDLEIKTTKGSGAGGQHRNKVETAVVIKHIPTGIAVRCENSRSQDTNKENALFLIGAKLKEAQENEYWGQRDKQRKEQHGTGMRGDKVRTIAIQRDQVVNHSNGKSTTWKKYSRGDFGDIR